MFNRGTHEAKDSQLMTVEHHYVGDVLVIGAGISGIVAASQLTQRGRRVALVDATGICAAQSGHAHGYLHRGYIYGDHDDELIQLLPSALECWDDLLAATQVQVDPSPGYIAFTNPFHSTVAARRWREHGLDVSPAMVPAGMGSVCNAYETPEVSVDVPLVLGTLATQNLRSALWIHAHAERVLRVGGTVVGVLVDTGAARVVLQAGSYLLAAGEGTGSLLTGITERQSPAGIARLSYMLVCRGPSVPAFSASLPENESAGLFTVRREPTSGDAVLLVSDFVSFDSAEDSHVSRALWLRGIWPRLLRVLPGLGDASTRWGLYAAPKYEASRPSASVPLPRAESFGLDNLLSLAPTKLTLAPLVAQQAAERLQARLPIDTERGVSHRFGGGLRALGELWTTTPLLPAREFWQANGTLGKNDESQRRVAEVGRGAKR